MFGAPTKAQQTKKATTIEAEAEAAEGSDGKKESAPEGDNGDGGDVKSGGRKAKARIIVSADAE